jgi:hypothetical protein
VVEGLSHRPREQGADLRQPRTLDATTDAHTIAGWWDEIPEANVAVATGKLSGVIAIDIDPR